MIARILLIASLVLLVAALPAAVADAAPGQLELALSDDAPAPPLDDVLPAPPADAVSPPPAATAPRRSPVETLPPTPSLARVFRPPRRPAA